MARGRGQHRADHGPEPESVRQSGQRAALDLWLTKHDRECGYPRWRDGVKPAGASAPDRPEQQRGGSMDERLADLHGSAGNTRC